VHGWVKTIRHHKNVSFVEISDGTSAESLQAVIKKNKRDGMHPAVDG
jgi:asparaginyl-tRNA synthetase